MLDSKNYTIGVIGIETFLSNPGNFGANLLSTYSKSIILYNFGMCLSTLLENV